MPHRSPALLAPLLLLALTAPPRAAAQEPSEPPRAYPDGIVAVVEGEPITRRELELACRLRSDFRALPAGSQERARVMGEELDELIKQRVLLERAERDGITFTEDDQRRLDWELARHAQDYRGIEGLRMALADAGIPYEYFVLRQKTNLLVGKLLVKNISREIFVTPAEIRRYYQEHPERFRRPGEVRVREIEVYPDPDDAYRVPEAVKAMAQAGTWDARQYAAALRARLLTGEPFEQVALEASMGTMYERERVFAGSERPSDVLIPPLGDCVEGLRVGEVSEVVESERGTLHLFLLVDRRDPGALPLEEVQYEIEGQLKERVWRDRLEAWIEEAKREAFVQRFLPASE